VTGGTLVVTRYDKYHSQIKKSFEKLGFTNVSITSKDFDGLNFVINDLKPRLVIIGSKFYEAGTPFMMGCLLKHFPKLRIVAVSTSYLPEERAIEFIWHGVKSYIDFMDGEEELLMSLQKIRQGEKYIAPGVQQLLDESSELCEVNTDETKRQKEVLLFTCNGLETQEIGEHLQISKRTTEGHLKDLYRIFGVHSKVDLVRMAFFTGIVTKEDMCFYRKIKPTAIMPKWTGTMHKTTRSYAC
jgi:two-component system nitrate/nitrite response regulator NarL